MRVSLKVSHTTSNSSVSEQNDELISVDEMQRVGNTQLIVMLLIVTGTSPAVPQIFSTTWVYRTSRVHANDSSIYAT